ncbi:hypothetical protein LvStA_02178 [Burkholderia gladioli]|nr:hypothetical protein LvStA_02178 [Burkholderia gladioli]
MVSPSYHFCSAGLRKVFFFHSGEGSTPRASPWMSMPVIWPKPNGFMKLAMLVTPRSRASM